MPSYFSWNLTSNNQVAALGSPQDKRWCKASSSGISDLPAHPPPHSHLPGSDCPPLTSNIHQPPRAPTSNPGTTDFESPYKLAFNATTSAVLPDVASGTVLLSAAKVVAAPAPAEPDVNEETPPLVLSPNGIRARFRADSEECGRYRFLNTLGKGTFGKVVLPEHVDTMEKRDAVQREIRLLPLLHHRHIMKVFDVIEDVNNVYLVIQYVSGGELLDYIMMKNALSDWEARLLFRQILSAVDCCHKVGLE
ncbi:kinase-like domain-containing protein [Blyttiomyces helicus]|uniref:Kinase-like domain-containing protein n=1 Tax=Blyttiomyces helicus TaxID=388810 RepID=A0A4P9W2M3_9FUNG|nr:kinase-like domain-containing protein [Blyttiomyces helicus]|eukprot:RKO86481.1 kinase-like domain-containing protein [Blyttiomyces helicus]